jgi:general secretion pathway protein A
MYAQFYGLRESPFALTPDPRYLFMSEPHKEALASAVYGVQERKGFVLILGEVGTGKTTLIRHLLGRFGPNIRSVFVFNPAVSFTELLQLMLRDLELPCPSMRRVEMIDTLNDYLLKEAAAGRYVVIIIDEAQHLSPTVLEEVRMLSNLETARGKLIQILLVGQPELGEKLGRPELRQLRQRISLVAELKPLSYRAAASSRAARSGRSTGRRAASPGSST